MKGKLGLDWGSSTADLILMKGNSVVESKAFESKNFDFLQALEEFPLQEAELIAATGFGARRLPDSIKDVPIRKIDEIKAIGLGGVLVSGKEDCLVASLGSGTCLVSGKTFKHVGGTAIGGGTVLGLGKLLLGVEEATEIERLAAKGDLEKVDLTMKKIYPEGIGLLDAEATASHFGDLGESSKEDLALALLNMVGQAIGSVAAFAAKSEGFNAIVFTGKMVCLKSFQEIVKERVLNLLDVELIVPENAEIATAIGAVKAEQ